MIYCTTTDKGPRKNNEDSYIAKALNYHLYLFAVADGLGGLQAGEVASKIAIEELTNTITKEFVDKESLSIEIMKKLLAAGFKKANDVLYSKVTSEQFSMGSTLNAALINNDGRGVIANIGDSRAYIIGDDTMWKTNDHSYVHELVNRGIITQEEARDHPQKNIVTKIIGMKDLKPDFFEIDIGKNTLLLCSDGLFDALNEEKIREVIISSKLKAICKNLLKMAKPLAKDNITIIAVRS